MSVQSNGIINLTNDEWVTLEKKSPNLYHAIRESNLELLQLSSHTLGQLPNQRGGRHHVHENQRECGIAYHKNGSWFPCSKWVNHSGDCGYADNTAF